MNSAGINTYGMLKTAFLTGLTALFVSALLQLNFPTLQEIGDNITLGWFERQMDLGGNKKNTMLQQGWTYYNLDHLAKAKACMEKAYVEENSVSALYCLGLIDLQYRKFDDGIEKLEKVRTFSPEHVPTMMALGQSYFQKKYYARSKDLFEKAVQCEPTNADARVWLGRTYINLNETDKAREVLSTVNSGTEAAQASALLKGI